MEFNMNSLELIENQITHLKDQGIQEETIAGYINESLMLAFIKTIGPKIDTLPNDVYEKIKDAINEGNIESVTNILFSDDNVDLEKIDDEIFALHLNEIFSK